MEFIKTYGNKNHNFWVKLKNDVLEEHYCITDNGDDVISYSTPSSKQLLEKFGYLANISKYFNRKKHHLYRKKILLSMNVEDIRVVKVT